MSAGAGAAHPSVSRDMALLAPKFRVAVESVIADMHADGRDAYVYEAHRSDELQKLYYARGRTVKPPERTVTNVASAQFGWHFFGLAVDIISKSKLWNAGDEWFEELGRIANIHGCKWGGSWKSRDTPHIQWGACKASPSDAARDLYAKGGLPAVWKAVGAAR